MFSDGPQPKNDVRLEMPLAPRAESHGQLKTLEIIWKSMVFSLQSWQCVTATQGGPQRTARNHAKIPLKTLGFLMFSAGPSLGIV